MDGPDSFQGDSLDYVEFVTAIEEAFPKKPSVAQLMLLIEERYPTLSAERRSRLVRAIEYALDGEGSENGDDPDDAIGVLARKRGPKNPRGGSAVN